MSVYMIVVYKAATTPGNYYTRKRTWGYYLDFETAEKAILENWTDMFECGYYDRAVIEKQLPGVCVGSEDEAWYTAEYEDYKLRVFQSPKPEWAYGICNMWGG